ncbi:MAG: AAA family ATPase [Anaerolineae bacterium]|nr:AAA family ATPase [Anaerolineae bacterium]
MKNEKIKENIKNENTVDFETGWNDNDEFIPEIIDCFADAEPACDEPDPPPSDLELPGTKNTWTKFTMADAYQERTPVKYAVDGIIELPSVNIVYGAPGALKSMIVLDMAMCVSMGIPWLTNKDGIKEISTTNTGVLWVDFDNGVRRTHDRVKAIGRHYHAPIDNRFFYVSCPKGGLNMGTYGNVDELRKAITPEIGLLIVDNLGLVSGGADENSSAMVPVMGNFRSLAEEKNIAIVIIHHERKGSGVHNGRRGETLRGHSSIEGAIDRSFHIVREDNSNKVNIIPVKERGNNLRPFSACFNYRGNGNILIEGWFEAVDSDNQERRIEKAILSLLRQGEANRSTIVKHVKDTTGTGRNLAESAIDRLKNSSAIVESKGKRNATIYSLSKNEQMILPPNVDIVHYNKEIVPTGGYLQ